MAKFTPYPYALFDNKIVELKDANISIMTNALHYGIGAFGGIKAFKTEGDDHEEVKIFRLDDHIARLASSSKTLGFNYRLDEKVLKNQILQLAQKNNLKGTTYIRPIIYRSDLDLSPDIAGEYSAAVYMLDMPNYFDPKKGLRVEVSAWQRNSDRSIPPKTKATGGYINSALAIDTARKNGFDSAIMLDKNGNVSEGAVMNLFLVKDGKLITPSLESSILEGITRKTILELARENGIEMQERTVENEELYQADEVFFCGTATDVTWCARIDDKNFGPGRGPMTEKIADIFSRLPSTHPRYFTAI